jgi:uncharacterized protein YciI
MPLYVMYGLDKPDGLELRKATRPAHLEWLKMFGDLVKLAGPVLGADGGTPVGSMIVIEAKSLEAAQAWAAMDPYTKAGLWERADIRPFTQTLP